MKKTLSFENIITRKEIDYVLRGDGEKTLVQFITSMEEGKCIKNISGISFFEAGEYFKNDRLELTDVKNTVNPDRDIYYKYDSLRNNQTKYFIASRGCPYNCTYCYNAELNSFFDKQYWRLRETIDVINEIKYVKGKYGLKWVHFQDGTFNANRKWLRAFLIDYSKESLPPFLCNVRPEHIDEEMIQLFKDAGCERMTFGIQSGNSRVRKEIAGRSMTDEQIINACQLCNRYKIRVGVDVIFGWPSETFEEAMDTIKLCQKVNVETYSSNVLAFYPGLRITKYAYENGYIAKLPNLEDVNQLDLNQTMLSQRNKNIFVNIDKLFFYLISFPRLEKLFIFLLKLPPNRFFCLFKNIHILKRCLKYDNKPKFKILKEYIFDNLKV